MQYVLLTRKMSSPAPIILIAFNRPQHTRQTLQSLSENFGAGQSSLFAFLDGLPPNPDQDMVLAREKTKEVILEKKWCGQVNLIERPTNLGIGGSTVKAINDILQTHDNFIFLEDDIVSSPGFLNYINQALSFYKDKPQVMHVSGFIPPLGKKLPETLFLNLTSCWGWGSWKRAWNNFSDNSVQLYEKLNEQRLLNSFTFNHSNFFESLLKKNGEVEKQHGKFDKYSSDRSWNWDVCWTASVTLAGGFCLHPGKSLIRNMGHDDTGIHCKESWYSKIFSNQKMADSVEVKEIPIKENEKARIYLETFNHYLSTPPVWEKIKIKFRQTFEKI